MDLDHGSAAQGRAWCNKPHLTRSRRLIWPWESALVISARFWRAFSASLILLLSEYSDNQILSSRSFRDMLRSYVGNRLLAVSRRSPAGRLKNLFRAGHSGTFDSQGCECCDDWAVGWPSRGG